MKYTQSELLDLVNRDNPDLPYPLTTSNVFLLTPPTTSLANGRNSVVKFNGIAGKGYSGKVTLYFDRLNIATLFPNGTITAVGPYGATQLSDILPKLNEKYGLALTVDDVQNPTYGLANIQSTTFYLSLNSAKSLCFTGSTLITWQRGPKTLPFVYPNASADTYDSMDVYGPLARYDFSASESTLSGVTQDTPMTSATTGAAALRNLLSNITGKTFFLASSLTQTAAQASASYNLTGFTVHKYTAAQSPAINPDYQYAYILTPTLDGQLSLPLILHVGKRSGV